MSQGYFALTLKMKSLCDNQQDRISAAEALLISFGFRHRKKGTMYRAPTTFGVFRQTLKLRPPREKHHGYFLSYELRFALDKAEIHLCAEINDQR